MKDKLKSKPNFNDIFGKNLFVDHVKASILVLNEDSEYN